MFAKCLQIFLVISKSCKENKVLRKFTRQTFMTIHNVLTSSAYFKLSANNLNTVCVCNIITTTEKTQQKYSLSNCRSHKSKHGNKMYRTRCYYYYFIKKKYKIAKYSHCCG